MLRFGQRACTRFKFPSHISLISRFHNTKMNASELFEEERLPWYSHDQFYPARPGEILDSSFKVIGKLGYGAYSTVWLCRDIRYVWRSSPPPTLRDLIMHGQRTRRWLRRWLRRCQDLYPRCRKDPTAQSRARFLRACQFHAITALRPSIHPRTVWRI